MSRPTCSYIIVLPYLLFWCVLCWGQNLKARKSFAIVLTTSRCHFDEVVTAHRNEVLYSFCQSLLFSFSSTAHPHTPSTIITLTLISFETLIQGKIWVTLQVQLNCACRTSVWCTGSHWKTGTFLENNWFSSRFVAFGVDADLIWLQAWSVRNKRHGADGETRTHNPSVINRVL